MLTAQLLSQRNVQALLATSGLTTVTTTQQLDYAAMIFATTEMIGFTMLWARLSPEQTRRRYRYYRLAAVILCTGYLAAATRARIAGHTLEASNGWDTILAWSLCGAMWCVMAIGGMRMCVCELKNFTYARELPVLIIVLLAHSIAWVAFLEGLTLAVTDQLGWTNTVDFRLQFHGCVFFYQAVLVYMVVAVPLAVKLQAYLGLDPVSRTWHKLQPLRLSLMTVVPESSFNLEPSNPRSQKTTLQLHHTIIEIRDAILRLRPYFREIASPEIDQFLTDSCVPTRERNAATHAFALAHAAKAKTIGTKPESPDTTLIAESRATTLDEETTELLKLAKWWTPAHTTTKQLTPSAPGVKASSPA